MAALYQSFLSAQPLRTLSPCDFRRFLNINFFLICTDRKWLSESKRKKTCFYGYEGVTSAAVYCPDSEQFFRPYRDNCSKYSLDFILIFFLVTMVLIVSWGKGRSYRIVHTGRIGRGSLFDLPTYSHAKRTNCLYTTDRKILYG